MRTLEFLPALALALGACGTTNAGEGTARGEPVWGKLGERVYVEGLAVTPLAVIEDSRCPADVQCVWAGRVRIRAAIKLVSGDIERELTGNEPVAIAGGMLELVDVRPAASSKTAILPEDYRLGLRFTNGS